MITSLLQKKYPFSKYSIDVLFVDKKNCVDELFPKNNVCVVFQVSQRNNLKKCHRYAPKAIYRSLYHSGCGLLHCSRLIIVLQLCVPPHVLSTETEKIF